MDDAWVQEIELEALAEELEARNFGTKIVRAAGVTALAVIDSASRYVETVWPPTADRPVWCWGAHYEYQLATKNTHELAQRIAESF